MKNTFSKGFTLVELLIVIAILAALAAAVVVVLNPAELLAQARDSQRLNDMGVVRDALALHLTQGVTGGGVIDLSTAGVCSVNNATNNGCCSLPSNCPNISSATPAQIAFFRNIRTVNGDGWVDVNLGLTLGGSPLSTLPIDPTNSGNFFYAYIAGGTDPEALFELNTRLESVRYRGMMANDGGSHNDCATHTGPLCFYEVGNSLTL